jgi:hypothetical protein
MSSLMVLRSHDTFIGFIRCRENLAAMLSSISESMPNPLNAMPPTLWLAES